MTSTPGRTNPGDETSDVVAELRRSFASGTSRPVRWRREQLRAIERMVTEREADIAAALKADLGRSAADSYFGDIVGTRTEARYARRHVATWARRERIRLSALQRPGAAWVQYEPLGVVLIIGPWNYPLYLSLAPLIGALAAGNCVVIKPSELAPATSRLLAQIVPEYLDHDAIRVVEGDAATTQALMAQRLDHVLFTGGTEVGRKIMAAAAPTLTPVTLELGGKSPVIVAADADLEVAARRIAAVKLLNSGQTCIAPDYVLADQVVIEELVSRIVAAIARFRAAEDKTGLPIVNRRQYDRLVAMVDTTSGKVVAGGGHDDATLRIEPTVVLDPDPSDSVMSEEIFGPVLPILGVESLSAAVAFVNARPKPLALYVFTESRARGEDVIDRVPSGGALINHVALHCTVPQLPFGGVGDSGFGAYHGRWGFETFSHRRAVLTKPARPDPEFVYPPHRRWALKLMRRLA